MTPRESVPLAPLTTLGLGGPARFFHEATLEDEIPAAETWALERKLPILVMGGGSNLLIHDRGFDGLVLRVALRGIRRLDAIHLEVGAGEEWDAFVSACVSSNLAGIECLSGIPGMAGGTPVQNVGAYGQEAAESLVMVRAWDRQARTWINLGRADCEFAYRSSLFNRLAPGRYIITSVRFRLNPGGEPALRYPELQRKLPSHPSLQQTRDAVREVRRAKSMLLDAEDPDSRSAGSFFKNPELPPGEIDTITAAAGAPPPMFPAAGGLVKVPAAWLMERAGFSRGYCSPTAPGVRLSRRHVLAIVNQNGTAAAVVALAGEIQRRVEHRFGVLLQPEPVLVGFGPGEGL